jgi:hypothetical protein
VESTEGKVSVRRKKQGDLMKAFLEKATIYELSTSDIVDTIIGLTSWVIIREAKPGYEDVTEALYLKSLKDAFANAKEIKRAESQ